LFPFTGALFLLSPARERDIRLTPPLSGIPKDDRRGTRRILDQGWNLRRTSPKQPRCFRRIATYRRKTHREA
jgi:hypothetical protein